MRCPLTSNIFNLESCSLQTDNFTTLAIFLLTHFDENSLSNKAENWILQTLGSPDITIGENLLVSRAIKYFKGRRSCNFETTSVNISKHDLLNRSSQENHLIWWHVLLRYQYWKVLQIWGFSYLTHPIKKLISCICFFQDFLHNKFVHLTSDNLFDRVR